MWISEMARDFQGASMERASTMSPSIPRLWAASNMARPAELCPAPLLLDKTKSFMELLPPVSGRFDKAAPGAAGYSAES